tara:strand:- start:400 stop:612 length:213 start_codon:yes stop_codon:yes gene_type:complete
MSSNNRNKQYLIDQILKRRGEYLEGLEMEQAQEELREKKILELTIILKELRDDAENTAPSFIDRLSSFVD